MKRKVTVDQHCFILFDGGLIHAGAPFDTMDPHYRMHIYIHRPGYAKTSGKTFKSDIMECGAKCSLCHKECKTNGK